MGALPNNEGAEMWEEEEEDEGAYTSWCQAALRMDVLVQQHRRRGTREGGGEDPRSLWELSQQRVEHVRCLSGAASVVCAVDVVCWAPVRACVCASVCVVVGGWV